MSIRIVLTAACLAAALGLAPAAPASAGSDTGRGVARTAQLIDVPVLRNRVGPGRVIEADDLRWVSLTPRQVGRNVITDPEELIGQSARRGIAPGTPVRAGEVQRPVMVGKGDLVTLTLTTPGMSLTALGRALEPGGHGEMIQVMNVQSKKTVAATVIGPNLVQVSAGYMLTVAN